jgi:hypothetical protein
MFWEVVRNIGFVVRFITSPGRRGLTFFLDEKSKQKNQDAPNSLNAQTVERRKGAPG